MKEGLDSIIEESVIDTEEFYNRHYITVDEQGRIVDGFSDAFRNPTNTDICINERGGYQFRLFPGGEENPALKEENGIPLYRYEGGVIEHRTVEDIAEDIAALPALEPTEDEKRDAQIFYTAMMTDTLLEEI